MEMSVRKAFRWYIEKYGIGEVQNRPRLVGILRDLCPHEKRLITMMEMVCSSDWIFSLIQEKTESPLQEKMSITAGIKSRLISEMGFSSEAVDQLIDVILYGYGWIDNPGDSQTPNWQGALQADLFEVDIARVREFLNSKHWSNSKDIDKTKYLKYIDVLKPAVESGITEAYYLTGELYKYIIMRCETDYSNRGIAIVNDWGRDAIEKYQADSLIMFYAEQQILNYTRAAEQGMAEAQYALSCAYSSNAFYNKNAEAKKAGMPTLPGDEKMAEKWLKTAADNGSPAACLSIAKKRNQSFATANLYYKKAIEYGGQTAERDYISFLMRSEEVPDKDEVINRITELLARVDDPGYAWTIAIDAAKFYRNNGNQEKAFIWAEKCVRYLDEAGWIDGDMPSFWFVTKALLERNLSDDELLEYVSSYKNSNAKYHFCSAFAGGMGDYQRAIAWYNRAAEWALTEGKYIGPDKAASCIYSAGLEYFSHNDHHNALKEFQKASDLGNKDALAQIGLMHENGIIFPKDIKKAISIYEQCYNGNSIDFIKRDGSPKNHFSSSIARRQLGKCYLFGNGVVANPQKAKEHFEEAGDHESLFWLGVMAEQGTGSVKNPAEAFRLFTLAFENGSLAALNELARHYAFGVGTTKNPAKAFEYYTKAANHGYRLAYRGVGMCYEYGLGVPKNEKQALEYYTKGAQSGDNQAMFTLAQKYEAGWFCTADVDRAIELYKQAAQTGHPSAANEVQRLLSERQRIEQQRAIEQQNSEIRTQIQKLEQKHSALNSELSQLHGLFVRKRRNEIEQEMAELEGKIRSLKSRIVNSKG